VKERKERSLRKRKLESLNTHGHKHAAGPARTLDSREEWRRGVDEALRGRGCEGARGQGGGGPTGKGMGCGMARSIGWLSLPPVQRKAGARNRTGGVDR